MEMGHLVEYHLEFIEPRCPKDTNSQRQSFVTNENNFYSKFSHRCRHKGGATIYLWDRCGMLKVVRRGGGWKGYVWGLLLLLVARSQIWNMGQTRLGATVCKLICGQIFPRCQNYLCMLGYATMYAGISFDRGPYWHVVKTIYI